MAHQTEAPHDADSQKPQRPDPVHDIDGKTTSIVLVVSTILVFGTVWALSFVFAEIIQNTREEVVERAPNTQLEELRASELNMLSEGVDPKRISVEQSIQELVKK